MKRFIFNANTITEINEHWNLTAILYGCKVKAGFKTHGTQTIYKTGPRTLIDQAICEITREALWSRKITQPVSVIAISKREDDNLHTTTFGLLNIYGKDNVASIPKDVAFEMVKRYDEGDHTVLAFARAAKNWNEILYAVRTNAETLSEHMERYAQEKKEKEEAAAK